MSPEEKPPIAALINGSVPFTAKRIDGTTEDVNIRLVPLGLIMRYIELVGDLLPFVELACDKPAGWAAALSDEAVYAIDEQFRGLNDFRCGLWLDRQAKAVTNMQPMMAKVSGLTKSLQTP